MGRNRRYRNYRDLDRHDENKGGVSLIITVIPPTPEQIRAKKEGRIAYGKLMGRLVKRGLTHIESNKPASFTFKVSDNYFVNTKEDVFWGWARPMDPTAKDIAKAMWDEAKYISLHNVTFKNCLMQVFRLAAKNLGYVETVEQKRTICTWQNLRNITLSAPSPGTNSL